MIIIQRMKRTGRASSSCKPQAFCSAPGSLFVPFGGFVGDGSLSYENFETLFMGASRTVYCLSCGQTYISSSHDRCPLCGTAGPLVVPSDPTALRDLRERKQEDDQGRPKTGREWIKSIVLACLGAPLATLGEIVAFIFIVTGVAVLILQVFEGVPSPIEPTAWFLIVAGVVKSLICGFLIWMSWKGLIAELAAEARSQRKSKGSG